MSEVFIVAGGPSLRTFDFSLLDDKKTITINRAFIYLKNPTHVYWADKEFHRDWEPELRQHECHRGVVQYVDDKPENIWYRQWLFDGERGISTTPGCLRHGFNSGCAAINLAVQLGYTTVYLLGYDGKPSTVGNHLWPDDGKGQKPVDNPETAFHFFGAQHGHLLKDLERLNISVVNLNVDSTVSAYPKMRWEDAFA